MARIHQDADRPGLLSEPAWHGLINQLPLAAALIHHGKILPTATVHHPGGEGFALLYFEGGSYVVPFMIMADL